MKSNLLFQLCEIFPKPQLPEEYTYSSVAGIIQGHLEAPETLSILMIKRVSRDGDPWSQHLAFPGGLVESADENLYQTAVRETKEEVGIELNQFAKYMGWMDTHAPRTQIKCRGKSLLVMPHFFHYQGPDKLILNPEEVDLAFWVPFTYLLNPKNYAEKKFVLSNNYSMKLPSLTIEQGEVWGITYVLLVKFLMKFMEHSKQHNKIGENEFGHLLRAWNLNPYL